MIDEKMKGKLTAWTMVVLGLLGMAWLAIMSQHLPVPKESVLHRGPRVVDEAEREMGLPETPKEFLLAASAEDIWVSPGMLYVLTDYAKQQRELLQQRRTLISISAAFVAVFSAFALVVGSRALRAINGGVEHP